MGFLITEINETVQKLTNSELWWCILWFIHTVSYEVIILFVILGIQNNFSVEILLVQLHFQTYEFAQKFVIQ